RYIGQAVDPAQRYYNHFNEISALTINSPRGQWLLDVLRRGCLPFQLILETEPERQITEVEYRWIKYAIKRGWPITNIHKCPANRHRGKTKQPFIPLPYRNLDLDDTTIEQIRLLSETWNVPPFVVIWIAVSNTYQDEIA